MSHWCGFGVALGGFHSLLPSFLLSTFCFLLSPNVSKLSPARVRRVSNEPPTTLPGFHALFWSCNCDPVGVSKRRTALRHSGPHDVENRLANPRPSGSNTLVRLARFNVRHHSRLSPATCATPSPAASNRHRPASGRPRRAIHPGQKLPAGEGWPEEQNFWILLSMIIFDGNSQICFHDPMRLQSFTKANRARAGAPVEG